MSRLELNTLFGLTDPFNPNKINPLNVMNPLGRPFLMNTDAFPLNFPRLKKKGGKLGPEGIPIPTQNISQVSQLSQMGSLTPLLGTLASVILPTVTAFIINKFLDKDKENDMEAIEQMEDVIDVVKDDFNIGSGFDDLDDDDRSLLNRILGKGIVELS